MRSRLLPVCMAVLVACKCVVGRSLNGYDESLAHEMLGASALSYCPSDVILNWSCKPCIKLPQYELFNLSIGLTPDGIETKVVFLVSKDERRIVVAFEGTHDPR